METKEMESKTAAAPRLTGLRAATDLEPGPAEMPHVPALATPAGCIELWFEGDALYARLSGAAGAPAISSEPVPEHRNLGPLRLVMARPLTAPFESLSLRDEDKKEVAAIVLSELSPDSRLVALKALAQRYLMPRILKVLDTRTRSGLREWKVETDRGPRTFTIRDPSSHLQYLSEDGFAIKDTRGNRYVLEDLNKLDPESVRNVQLIL